MPRFACPHCKTPLSAGAEQRGTIVTCASCGKKIRVPAGKPAAAKPAPPPSPAPEPKGPVTKKPPPPPPREDEDDHDPDRGFFDRPQAQDVEDQDDDDNGERSRPEKKAKQTSMVTSVAGGVVVLLGLALFILIISGKWVTLLQKPIQQALEDQGIHPVLAIVVAAAILLVPLGLFWLRLVKSTILGAMPSDVEFRAAKPEQFEDLDQDKLAELTAAFEELGFRRLVDYTIEADVDLNRAFARLMAHEQENCYAELNQAFAPGRSIPMRFMVMSFLDDDWSAAVTNRMPSKEGYLLRLPRAAWRSFPDAEPDQLFQELLTLRKGMVRDLKVAVVDDNTAKAYFTREKARTRARKESVGRRWALGIQIEFWLFERNPKMAWLGEYAAKARKSRARA